MDPASLRSIVRAAGILLLGMLPPAACVAAEQGWSPVVARASKAESLPSRTPPPPIPHPKSAAIKKMLSDVGVPIPPAPASSEPSTVASAEAEITTGSIDPIKSTRMLSPEDSARLLAEEGDPPADELTTGAVDNQGSDLARGYCVNIASAAADARTAMQMAKLAQVEKEIGKRIASLEAKSAEYKAWVERRDEFLKRATSALVKIYTQMEPEAAGLQLVAMDEETAAALLMKLEPQNASAILNEMPPDKAARLTATVAGAARVPKTNGSPAGAAAAARPGGDAPARANPDEGRS